MQGTFDPNLISTGIKTGAMLLIVLGILISVLYLARRFLLLRRGGKGGSFIKVISSHYLSPKERIEVVEVLGERLVLGITPGNISFLTKIAGFDENNGRMRQKRDDNGSKEK